MFQLTPADLELCEDTLTTGAHGEVCLAFWIICSTQWTYVIMMDIYYPHLGQYVGENHVSTPVFNASTLNAPSVNLL